MKKMLLFVLLIACLSGLTGCSSESDGEMEPTGYAEFADHSESAIVATHEGPEEDGIFAIYYELSDGT